LKKIVKRFSIVSAGALLGSTLGLASAAYAAGTTVACGQVITTSITLTNDVGPCLGDGLIVKGFSITVDMAGHTIKGAASDPASAIDQAGIHLDNVSGVTVKGGTVRGFFAGVLVKGGSGNTITDMKVFNNVGLGTTLYSDGIVLDGSTNNKVTTNRVTGNGPYAGIHMINNASNNRVLRNFVADNHVPSIGLGPGGTDLALDSGIALDSDSSYNVISDNQVLRNGFFGIKLAGVGTSHDQAINNTIKDNGNAGINAGGNGHTVAGNLIDHNGYEQFLPVGATAGQNSRDGVITCGVPSPPGRPCGNDPAIIQDNSITRNAGIGVDLVFNGSQVTGGCGIYGCFPAEPYSPPRSNLVQRNIVRNNGGDGIFVECDQLYDANFDATCITTSPDHKGQRILNNTTSGNGGANAGISAWDLHDQNPRCDDDIWSGNTYDTAKPFCTTR
jgi:parallel beta-helix repeat protein